MTIILLLFLCSLDSFSQKEFPIGKYVLTEHIVEDSTSNEKYNLYKGEMEIYYIFKKKGHVVERHVGDTVKYGKWKVFDGGYAYYIKFGKQKFAESLRTKIPFDHSIKYYEILTEYYESIGFKGSGYSIYRREEE